MHGQMPQNQTFVFCFFGFVVVWIIGFVEVWIPRKVSFTSIHETTQQPTIQKTINPKIQVRNIPNIKNNTVWRVSNLCALLLIFFDIPHDFPLIFLTFLRVSFNVLWFAVSFGPGSPVRQARQLSQAAQAAPAKIPKVHESQKSPKPTKQKKHSLDWPQKSPKTNNPKSTKKQKIPKSSKPDIQSSLIGNFQKTKNKNPTNTHFGED